MTVLLHDERARFGLPTLSPKILEHLSIDQAAERTCGVRHASREQVFNLIHDTAVELLVDASSEPLAQRCRRETQRNRVHRDVAR
jgi:hypothetical protein